MTEQQARENLANYILNRARKDGSHIVGSLGYSGGLNVRYASRTYSLSYFDPQIMDTKTIYEGSRKGAMDALIPLFIVEK